MTDTQSRSERGSFPHPLIRMFVFSLAAQLRPLLRPSARRDLARYISGLSSDQSAKEWLRWAHEVLTTFKTEARTLRVGRTGLLIRAAPIGAFRRPDRAYRVRWIF
jgi:hypothetical protein